MTSRQRWTLVATVIGSGAVFLDGTIVNSALPRIGRELPASVVGVLEGQTYVVSGYLAILAALLILAGALSDRYGRRRIYALGLAGFAVTSGLCGLAPTLEILVIARLLQGAAGALMVPGALSIITQTFAETERGRAFGLWTSATSALALVGPLVGGLLVDTIGWRIAFLVNVPILAIALVITLRYVAESKDIDTTRRFDWLGSIVAALAVGGLSFGVIRGGEHAWQDSLAWGSLAVGAVALALFPILMAKRPDPLVPLGLFRSRAFTTINVATFFVYGGLYVMLSYLSITLQGALGYTALAAGAAVLPVGICLVTLSTRIGSIAGRSGARRFLTLGPAVHGGRIAVVHPPAGQLGAVGGQPRSLGLAGAAGVVHGRHPAGGRAVRDRHRLCRGPADEHPDGLDPGAVLRARIGHQQRDRARRPAAPRCAHLRGAQQHLLRPPGVGGTRPRPELRGRPRRIPTAQPATPGCHRGAGRSRSGRVGRGVPPGDGRGGHPRRDRRGDLVVRSAPEGPLMSRDWDARTYDRVAEPMTRWGTSVVDRLPLDGDERVLDAGCGTGRVTALLVERLPRGRVIALDGSPSMLAAARERLAPYGPRVEYVVADLGRPLPIDGLVDAVLSTATFHWVPDHDALFVNLAAVTRPGGRLVAQCGGVGNIETVQAALATIGDGWLGPVHFETPEATERRLAATGFVDIACWLTDEPTRFEPGAPFETYLRTVVLGAHLERLPAGEHDAFVRAVADAIGDPVIDYVRLNITARRAGSS